MSSNTVIEATVPSGFERIALEEIAEKIPGISDTSSRGHIRFHLPTNLPISEQIKKLKTLRSVDNMYVVIGTVDVDFPSKRDIKSGLIPVIDGLVQLDWQRSIEFWREFTQSRDDWVKNVDGSNLLGYMDVALAHLDELMQQPENPPVKEQNKSEQSPNKNGQRSRTKPIDQFAFRVTGVRSGDGHSFTSKDVATEVGGLLKDGFGWEVNLSDYDMEVFVIVRFNSVSYCLTLTHQSRHRRNDVQRLGNMSLRSTISYNMLRLCGIELGDFVVDPMCGSGAVIVESMLSEYGPNAFHIAGDFSEMVVQSKAYPSMQSASVACQNVKGGDCMTFSAAQLPFRTASVDVIIADMPFGKRCGNKGTNKWLYPAVLNEFARVLVPSTGRACLLSADFRNMNTAMWSHRQPAKGGDDSTNGHHANGKEGEPIEDQQVQPGQGKTLSGFWMKPYRSFTINHGGLNPMVYLLRRSAMAFV